MKELTHSATQCIVIKKIEKRFSVTWETKGSYHDFFTLIHPIILFEYIKDKLENMLFRPISKLEWYKRKWLRSQGWELSPYTDRITKTPQLVISLAFSAVLASLRSLRTCWPCSKAITSSLKWCTLMLVMIRPFFTISTLMVATLLDFIIILSKQVKGNHHQQAFWGTCLP